MTGKCSTTFMSYSIGAVILSIGLLITASISLNKGANSLAWKAYGESRVGYNLLNMYDSTCGRFKYSMIDIHRGMRLLEEIDEICEGEYFCKGHGSSWTAIYLITGYLFLMEIAAFVMVFLSLLPCCSKRPGL